LVCLSVTIGAGRGVVVAVSVVTKEWIAVLVVRVLEVKSRSGSSRLSPDSITLGGCDVTLSVQDPRASAGVVAVSNRVSVYPSCNLIHESVVAEGHVGTSYVNGQRTRRCRCGPRGYVRTILRSTATEPDERTVRMLEY